LHSEIARALKAPAVEQRLRADGSEPSAIPPAEISAIVLSDVQRWRKIVKENGIKAES
jgi:tripartite-type tricarboxylate transporter receptor subunit TctC